MNIYLRSFKLCLSEFRNDEQGSMTVFGLFFFLFTCILAAFAVDVSNLFAQRTHLQTAADQAGHAAIYRLWTSSDPASAGNQSDAINDARSVALYTLPRARTGGAIADEDIQIVFGDWNSSTQTFAPGVGYSAVRVETSFRGTNAVASFFFRLIGFDDFDVYAASVWDTNANGCFSDGFMSMGALDLNSGNVVGGEFCLVSNTEVTKNNGNVWGTFPADGTGDEFVPANIIMPHDAYLDAYADGNSGNPGWQESLVRYGDTAIPLLGRTESLIYNEMSKVVDAGFLGSSEVDAIFNSPPVRSANEIAMPSYINSDNSTVTLVDMQSAGAKSLTPLTLGGLSMTSPGVYYVDCPNNGTLVIDMDPGNPQYNGMPFIEDMVIMTTCRLDFAAGSVIESARFIVMNDSGLTGQTGGTGPKSVNGGSGLTFGSTAPGPGGPDDCEASELYVAEDGQTTLERRAAGVQIYTMGAAHFPSAFDGYGLQMVAAGNVSMASGGGGTNSQVEKDFIGSSVISGQEISLSAKMNLQIGCHPIEGNGTAALKSITMVN